MPPFPEAFLYMPSHSSRAEAWCFFSQARNAAGVSKKVGVIERWRGGRSSRGGDRRVRRQRTRGRQPTSAAGGAGGGRRATVLRYPNLRAAERSAAARC